MDPVAAAKHETRLFLAYASAMGLLFVLTPLSGLFLGKFGAMRDPQIALNALLFVALWRTRRFLSDVTLTVPRWLFWATLSAALFSFIVAGLTHLYSFSIHAIDFSIFDWMLGTAVRGRFMYSPVYEVFHLGVHPTYVLFPLVPLHGLFDSNVFLMVVNAVVLWVGAFPAYSLARRFGLSEGAALLAVLAYLTNPWIGYLANEGFRPESFYPALGLAFADAWCSRSRWAIALTTLGFLAIKEDAALYLLSLSLAALVVERERWREAGGILAASGMVLGLNMGVVQPHFLALSGLTRAGYLSYYWAQYGRTLPAILVGMLSSPLRLARDLLTSHWYTLLLPAGLLPFLAPLPLAGMAPSLFMLGSTLNVGMREYAFYYPITLVPFVFWGIFEGAKRLRARTQWANAWAVLALLAFPLFGGSYMRFLHVDGRMKHSAARLQSKLQAAGLRACAAGFVFPHLGYDVDLHLLDEACTSAPRTAFVVSDRLDPHPVSHDWVNAQLESAAREGRLEKFEEGLFIVWPR